MGNFIPLSVPNLNGNEEKYVLEAVSTSWVSTAGPMIVEFEEQFSKYFGIDKNNSCACQSGTAGLHLCLRHFNVGINDIVLVPSLTFIATINSVMYQNATPVFFDCEENLCINPNQIQEYIVNYCSFENDILIEKTSKKQVKAIIPVHIFGDLCNMEHIMEIADKYNLIVIEDATESLGSKFDKGKYNNKLSGLIGHAGVFSFNGNKIMTTGGGGMVISNDTDTINHIRYLSQQAKDDMMYFVHEEYGYNYRMTNLQAALGVAQLEQLDDFIKAKQDNYLLYKEKLSNCKIGKILPFSTKYSNCWFYTFCLNEPSAELRDKLLKGLNEQNIQVRPIWKLNHLQTPFKDYFAMDMTNSTKFYDSIINIPCSSSITLDEIDVVCDAILKFE